jgi:hypothetical protein
MPGPTVLFAYNITTVTGGKISTSPVLSLDGTKIAFVESVPGAPAQAIFHVLTWARSQGAIKNAAAPGASMTSVTFSPTSNCTTSSPWVDYGADVAYVGSDKGIVYKITGVFNGTPTLVTTFPWPVTVHTNFHLSPPVLDGSRSALMVGSSDGNLYRINTTTGALTPLLVGIKGGTTPGIVGPPIVDVTNGTTFVVSANDGTSAVLVQADTATMKQLSKARIGQGSTVGTPVPVLNLYEPAFSNDYFNDPSTGVIRLCGTDPADTNPWQYSFGFGGVGGITMNTKPTLSQRLLTSTTARCTGWTEFFNPNVGVGGTDFFFFGLTRDCTVAGGAGGCVAETTGDTAATTVTVAGGPSGIIVDNYSTAAQASSIYLTSEVGGTGYKFTQNGLQ